MKLYDVQRAPNPRRVRIFLAEKGIDIPRVELNLLENDERQKLRERSGRALVPLLELDDGTLLDESVAICRYLEEQYPEPNLLGRDGLEKALIESWQRHVEFDGFIPMLEHFRNTTPMFAGRGVPGAFETFEQIPALAERGRRRYDMFLESFNDRLAGSEFVAGDRFSIADITAFCTVDFATRVLKIELPGSHTHSRRWYESVGNRPSAAA